MANNGRPPFKGRVPFRRKHDNDAWYRTGSHDYTQMLHPDGQSEIPTPAGDDFDRALLLANGGRKRELDRNVSQHHDSSDASGKSKHYANSVSSGRGGDEYSQQYGSSDASGISKHYANMSLSSSQPRAHISLSSDASGISKHYAGQSSSIYSGSGTFNRSNHSYDVIESGRNFDQHSHNEMSNIHPYQNGHSSNNAPQEIVGIPNNYEYAASDISGVSKHYAQTGSEVSGVSSHVGKYSDAGRSEGEISKFYSDAQQRDGFGRPKQHTKKSRFLVPEVSKLWFFQQNNDSHDNDSSGNDHNKRTMKPLTDNSDNRSDNSSAGDDVVFDINNDIHTGIDIAKQLDPRNASEEPVMEEPVMEEPVIEEPVNIPVPPSYFHHNENKVQYSPPPSHPKSLSSTYNNKKLLPSFDPVMKKTNKIAGILSPGDTASTVDTNLSPSTYTADTNLFRNRNKEFPSCASILSMQSNSVIDDRSRGTFTLKKVIISVCVFFFLSIAVVVVLLLLWVYTDLFQPTEVGRTTQNSDKIYGGNVGSKTNTNTLDSIGLKESLFESPSTIPSQIPSSIPIYVPSSSPTQGFSNNPSYWVPVDLFSMVGGPTHQQRRPPTPLPSKSPTRHPSRKPSHKPTIYMSSFSSISSFNRPTLLSSTVPSNKPSVHHSITPSLTQISSSPPTLYTSIIPSLSPSLSPSTLPSISPTMLPSSQPSFHPSPSPISSSTGLFSIINTPAPTESSFSIFYVTGGRFADADVIYPPNASPPPFVEALLNFEPQADFFVHLGDFNDPELTSCSIQSYQRYSSLFEFSPIPALMVVGANDWPNCPDPNSSEIFWKDHFATTKIEHFWPNSDIHMDRFSPSNGYVGTQFAFVRRRILFLSINLYRAEDELDSIRIKRDDENLDWVKDRVSVYKDQFDIVVIFGNDSPQDDDQSEAFFASLDSEILQFFSYPTLYVHESLKGKNKLSKKQFNTEYISSLEIAGGELPLVKVTVDLENENKVFSFALEEIKNDNKNNKNNKDKVEKND